MMTRSDRRKALELAAALAAEVARLAPLRHDTGTMARQLDTEGHLRATRRAAL